MLAALENALFMLLLFSTNHPTALILDTPPSYLTSNAPICFCTPNFVPHKSFTLLVYLKLAGFCLFLTEIMLYTSCISWKLLRAMNHKSKRLCKFSAKRGCNGFPPPRFHSRRCTAMLQKCRVISPLSRKHAQKSKCAYLRGAQSRLYQFNSDIHGRWDAEDDHSRKHCTTLNVISSLSSRQHAKKNLSSLRSSSHASMNFRSSSFTKTGECYRTFVVSIPHLSIL